jgi:hypothetical protein
MQRVRIFGLLVLMALLVSVYTLTSSGRFHIVDEVSLYAVTESQALRGAVDSNTIAWTQWVNSAGEVLGAFGPDGDVYSKKGPAPAFLAVPWYLLLHIITELNVGIGQLQATLLWNGIVTAMTAALLWLTARRLGYGDRTGMTLGLLFGLATIAWPYANQFFGEPLSALSLLIVFYGMATWRRAGGWWWLALAGAGAALTITTVTAHTLLIAIFGGWWLVDWLLRRRTAPGVENSIPALLAGAAAFAAPIVLAGALLALYNFVRFGSPLETGYHFDSGEGFSTPFLTGFWGLIFSPYRGVFWHTPLFIASIAAFVPFVRRHRSEAILIALLSGVLVGMYSLWWMWWGGFAWGPRFLVPLTPLWVLVLAPVVARLAAGDWRLRVGRQGDKERGRRGDAGQAAPISNLQSPISNLSISQSPLLTYLAWFTAAMAVISFVVQVGAVSVNFVNYEILLRSLYPTDWSDPLRYGPPAQSLADLMNSPVVGQFKLIAQDLRANSDLAWLWADGTTLWLVVLIGGAAIVTLLGALFLWWRMADQPDNAATFRAGGVVSAPSLALVVLIPALVIATWSGEVGREPTYGIEGAGYRAILHDLCRVVTATDAFVNITPADYHIPMNWMPGECKTDIPTFGYAADSMNHPETEAVLTRALAEHDRLWFVTSGVQPNDPNNTIERWLADRAYKATDVWYENFRLVQYATALRLGGVEERPINEALLGRRAEQVTITSVRAPSVAAAGKPIPIDIQYRLEAPTDQNLRWFVQLLSGQNIPLAQLDTAPNDNYVTFSSLPAREVLTERAGLPVPENMPEGDYLLIAGLYNPDDEGARLITIDGPDFVSLGAVRVVKPR